MRPLAWQRAASGTQRIGCTNAVRYGGNLSATASLLAREIGALLNCPPLRTSNDRDLAAGDVYLDGNGGLPTTQPEAYGIDIYSGGAIWVDANNETGLFWGTRTLLQLIRRYAGVLPAGGHGDYGAGGNTDAGVDYPEFPERTLMLDIGRYKMPISLIKQYIREASYVKMNLLQLHVSDGDDGIRLLDVDYNPIVYGSDRLNDYSAADSYSRDEINEIICYARQYHMEIIPEIDMPGHCGWIRKKHADWTVPGYDQACDVSRPEVRDTLNAIVRDYYSWFPYNLWFAGGDEWLIGDLESPARNAYLNMQANEYPGNCVGPYCDTSRAADATDIPVMFLNEISDWFRDNAYPRRWVRVWGDALAHKNWRHGTSLPYGTGRVMLSTDIVLAPWNAELYPQEAIDNGYNLVDASARMFVDSAEPNSELYPFLYINAPKGNGTPPEYDDRQGSVYDHYCWENADAEKVPYVVNGGDLPCFTVNAGPGRIKGIMSQVWGDAGLYTIFDKTKYKVIYTAAQIVWDSPHLPSRPDQGPMTSTSPNEFVGLINILTPAPDPDAPLAAIP